MNATGRGAANEHDTKVTSYEETSSLSQTR